MFYLLVCKGIKPHCLAVRARSSDGVNLQLLKGHSGTSVFFGETAVTNTVCTKACCEP